MVLADDLTPMRRSPVRPELGAHLPCGTRFALRVAGKSE